jgi:hypothetical protein
MDMSPVSTTVYPGHDPVKPEITERPVNPWENTAAPETTVAPYESGKCPKAWYVPSPMEVACTDYNNEGSFCSFSCPDNLKVRIPDNPNRLCMENKWQGDVPQCCERDGCPADLRVDFFFILDSSSSIKDKNFQFIREYVIGLIATMPIGLDKTRVGIITYNNEVSLFFITTCRIFGTNKSKNPVFENKKCVKITVMCVYKDNMAEIWP